jgi:hypothetical protein
MTSCHTESSTGIRRERSRIPPLPGCLHASGGLAPTAEHSAAALRSHMRDLARNDALRGSPVAIGEPKPTGVRRPCAPDTTRSPKDPITSIVAVLPISKPRLAVEVEAGSCVAHTRRGCTLTHQLTRWPQLPTPGGAPTLAGSPWRTPPAAARRRWSVCAARRHGDSQSSATVRPRTPRQLDCPVLRHRRRASCPGALRTAASPQGGHPRSVGA